MTIRFRRSLRLFPGFRLNIGKTGITSVSAGVRGAHVIVGKHGTVAGAVGVPGTGLSFRQRLGRLFNVS